MNIKALISVAITVVIAIALTPVIFSSVWTDNIGCDRWNTTATGFNCQTGANNADLTLARFCSSTTGAGCITGTASTLLQLVPFIYVGIVILGGIIAGIIATKS